MDTINILYKTLTILLMNDTLIIKSLNEIHNLITNNQNESFYLKLLPSLGVITGVLLTMLGQYLIKNHELKLSLIKEARDAKHKILLNLICLQSYLGELAYLEIDSKYQYFLSETESLVESRKKALDEHYNDYKYISECKSKITNCIAEINASIFCYHECKKIKISDEDYDTLKTSIESIFNLRRPDHYDTIYKVNQDDLDNDIQILKSNYLQSLNDIEEFANDLK